MKGCHNCEYNLLQFESFDESPCANCRTAQPPSISGRTEPMNIQLCEQHSCMHPAYVEKDTEKDAMFKALANCIFSLLRLKDKYPETFDFAMAKIQNPSWSYEKIAEMRKCKKQNVHYHLRRAVLLFRELKPALLVDPRFN